MTRRFLPYSVVGLLLAGGTNLQAAFNFEVSGVQTQIFDTTTDVPGSGTSGNFDSGTVVGDFAVFDMDAVDDANGTRSDFADLRVTYAADNGSVGADIMIARTSDSQGLTDSGTITILVGNINSGGGTVTLDFDWFTPGSFVGGVEQASSSQLSTRINYTTFDIDFEQLVRVQRAEVDNYTLDNPTLLTATDNGTTISFEDSGATSSFGDPDAAAQFLTTDAIASHTVEVGKQNDAGNALFMFEFRDPSDVVTFLDPDTTPVPEPAILPLWSALFGLLSVMRRRRV